jgi:hypothetical protein
LVNNLSRDIIAEYQGPFEFIFFGNGSTMKHAKAADLNFNYSVNTGAYANLPDKAGNRVLQIGI